MQRTKGSFSLCVFVYIVLLAIDKGGGGTRLYSHVCCKWWFPLETFQGFGKELQFQFNYGFNCFSLIM